MSGSRPTVARLCQMLGWAAHAYRTHTVLHTYAHLPYTFNTGLSSNTYSRRVKIARHACAAVRRQMPETRCSLITPLDQRITLLHTPGQQNDIVQLHNGLLLRAARVSVAADSQTPMLTSPAGTNRHTQAGLDSERRLLILRRCGCMRVCA